MVEERLTAHSCDALISLAALAADPWLIGITGVVRISTYRGIPE
jgi:hypothetical protein